MQQKRKVLFVINTLGQGGAESALIEFMKKFYSGRFDMYLYVILGQGDMIGRVPPYVKLLNEEYDERDVLSGSGKRALMGKTLSLMLNGGAVFRNIPFMAHNIGTLKGEGKHHPEKLLWQVIVDGCPAPEEHFDLAVAYLEGASTYYLARKVSADKKIAFVHTDYVRSGYTRELDKGAYDAMDRIYCVSEETKKSFLQVYPEHALKTEVFYNIINRKAALKKADRRTFFDTDGFDGERVVSLGRLVRMKAVDKSIKAMRILKDSGKNVRWYVFGEGNARAYFESLIDEYGLRDCFFLPGAVSNPFPYLKKASVYCQCSDYEGRSVAISEAQLLGCPVITSNHSGSSGQVNDGEDGLLIEPTPENIAAAVSRLLDDHSLSHDLGKAAADKMSRECDMSDFTRILDLMDRKN